MNGKFQTAAYIVIPCIFFLLMGCSNASEDIHKCTGAGFWFPANPTQLSAQVDDFMEKAPSEEISGNIVALISPHAGYRFAGEVMGAGYRQIKGKKYKRVIILAFSHSMGGWQKISVLPVKSYETPLGMIPTDIQLTKKLLEHKDVFTTFAAAHKREHSDENQLPFLQKTLKDFSIVSLMVDMRIDDKTMEKAVEILAPLMDEETLFIASTDLNHYGTGYGYFPFKNLKGKKLVERIHSHDREALKYMENIDPNGFRSYLDKTGATVCGKMPVELLLLILETKKNVSGKILHYYTSADKSGNHEVQTCGYGSVVFTLPKGESLKKEEKIKMDDEKTKSGKASSSREEPDPPILSEQEQQTLLRLARETLEGITKDKSFKPDISQFDITPNLKEKSRLFVTLTKNGKLRGCIGHVAAIEPIYAAVIENTISAAFRDSRFPPVKADEVPEIRIEISINTPQRLIKDVNKIEIGKHGLILEKGWNRGLLLPQVPVEWGWDRDEFLKGICRKARLPNGSWEHPDAKLYIYSSQVFHEKEVK